MFPDSGLPDPDDVSFLQPVLIGVCVILGLFLAACGVQRMMKPRYTWIVLRKKYDAEEEPDPEDAQG